MKQLTGLHFVKAGGMANLASRRLHVAAVTAGCWPERYRRRVQFCYVKQFDIVGPASTTRESRVWKDELATVLAIRAGLRAHDGATRVKPCRRKMRTCQISPWMP